MDRRAGKNKFVNKVNMFIDPIGAHIVAPGKTRRYMLVVTAVQLFKVAYHLISKNFPAGTSQNRQICRIRVFQWMNPFSIYYHSYHRTPPKVKRIKMRSDDMESIPAISHLFLRFCVCPRYLAKKMTDSFRPV